MAAESSNQVTGSSNQYQEEIIAHWNGRSREYDSRPHHGLQSQREKEVWLETLRSFLQLAPAVAAWRSGDRYRFAESLAQAAPTHHLF